MPTPSRGRGRALACFSHHSPGVPPPVPQQPQQSSHFKQYFSSPEGREAGLFDLNGSPISMARNNHTCQGRASSLNQVCEEDMTARETASSDRDASKRSSPLSTQQPSTTANNNSTTVIKTETCLEEESAPNGDAAQKGRPSNQRAVQFKNFKDISAGAKVKAEVREDEAQRRTTATKRPRPDESKSNNDPTSEQGERRQKMNGLYRQQSSVPLVQLPVSLVQAQMEHQMDLQRQVNVLHGEMQQQRREQQTTNAALIKCIKELWRRNDSLSRETASLGNFLAGACLG